MKISICLLTHNRLEIIKENIAALERIQYHPSEIVIVDNHSNDGTEKYLPKLFPHITYLRTKKNIGVAARNLALESAKGDIIICLDDDVFGLSDNHIYNIIRLFTTDPNIGAINFKIIDYYTGDICNWVHHRREDIYASKKFLTYELTEGAVALKKEAILAAGLYDENFFISHEGIDLALRIMDSGYRVIYYPNVKVFHKHSSDGRTRWLNYYYDTRNLFYVASKLFPLSYTIKYISIGTLSMCIYSIRDGYIVYWIKGIVDGVRLYRKALKKRCKLQHQTMNLVRKIDKKRPSIFYMLKKRLVTKGARL